MNFLSTMSLRPEEVEKIKSLGVDLKIFSEEQKESIDSDTLANADALIGIIGQLGVDFLDKCKKLRWVHLPHVGIDKTPMAYFNERHIMVTHSSGAVGIPISEDIFSKMLALARGKKIHARHQGEHKWTSDATNRQMDVLNLHGKTVGILGAGDVGGETAKRAKAFGMVTVGLNTSGKSVANFDEVYSTSDIDKLISQSDFIVCTLPLTKDTYHLVDGDQFKLMKPTVYIINISRADIFNEDILFEYLKDKKIGGAGLDVFSQEPLPSDSPFWDLDNLIISPHCAALGDDLHERLSKIMMHNIECFCNGKINEMLNIRDYDKGY